MEIAIGDAYGAGFEYAEPRKIREENDLSRYARHPRHRLRPGNYTDDTQMSIAIAELMVSGKEWTRENVAQHFVDTFKRDPREGYAGRFYHFLCEIENGKEFLKRIRPESDKSGAAMRASPIGMYPSVEEVQEKSTLQARLTHDTRAGIRAAVAASLMSHYFLYAIGPKDELGTFLESHVPGNWSEAWKGKVGSKGWMSVHAAVTAVTRHGRMSHLLKACVDFSGDVDTVAAIALGAASCSDEIEQDLPDSLYNDLENGPYGRDFLLGLDQTLAEAFPRGR